VTTEFWLTTQRATSIVRRGFAVTYLAVAARLAVARRLAFPRESAPHS
jgi:hypothetical protein